MSDQKIKNYIKQALENGQTKEQIHQFLLGEGWLEKDITDELDSFEKDSYMSLQEPSVLPVEATKADLKRRFSFLKIFFKTPRIYYFLAVIFLIIIAFFLYSKIFLKEEISEFELIPKIIDTAGISPETSFILKSSVDLNVKIIEKHFKFEPEIDYKIKKISSESSVFEITPINILDENKIYSLAIFEGPIAARTYSWAYQVKAPFQVISSIPRDKTSSVPVNTGIEIVFNRENLINPEKSFEIFPSVSGKFEIYRNTLVFVPFEQLQEKTLYTIKIKSGIKAEGSNDTFVEDKEIKFETSVKYSESPQPYFDFSKRFWENKPGIETVFEVHYSNIPTKNIPFIVYKLDSVDEFVDTFKSSLIEENNWSRYHRYELIDFPESKKVFQSEIPIEEQARVRFVRMPQKLSEGFYAIESIINNQRKQTWLQVTSVTNFSAISGSKTLLWFKDLESNDNVVGADVFFEENNLGKTNNHGIAMFNTPDKLIREKNESGWYYSLPSYFFIVNLGNKKLAVPIENDRGYFSKVYPPDAWWDYFSTDKTIYSPSDKIHFWGIARQRNGTDIKGEKMIAQLTNRFWEYNSRDSINVFAETEVIISDFYTITGSISFSHLKPGLYQLSIKRGDEIIISETINIKTYIKPAYRLILTPDKKAVFAGETINYKVKAEFFEGTPVSNLKIKYYGYFDERIAGEIQLDNNGEGWFTAKTSYQGKYWPRYFGMVISSAVAEEGEIAASASVLVFGSQIDLRTEQSISETKSKFNLKLKSVILEKIERGDPWWVSDNYLGKPINQWEITADIVEIIYHKEQIDTGYDVINKTTYPIYQYSIEEKHVTQDILRTDNNGTAYYEWTAEENKTYRITFSATDVAGRKASQEHYVYGKSFSYFGFYDSRGAILKNLNKDKDDYKLDDAIKLQMQDIGGNALKPSPESFIFIRVVNGIISYEISDSPDYSDSFKNFYIPNLEVIGAWFSGSRFTIGSPGSYGTWVNIPFASDEHRLNIEIIKNKEYYRPREKVDLSILVKDKDGKPKQAEVNVSGIDEAIFSLNPIEKDITSLLYQNIFSLLMIRSSHVNPLESEAELGGCFLANTMILTPQGKKPIQELRIGDEILTRKSEILSEKVKTRIKQIGSYLVDQHLVFNGNLRLTLNHQLLVNNSWRRAGEVKIGDVLLTENNRLIKVFSIEPVKEWGLVYNIELQDYQTYFADGIYVHNAEKGGGGGERTDFRDLAIYQSIHTDSKGQAKVSFDLPDNLTSWRITAQAVTKDLFAGKTIDFIPVSLPFFIEATMNRTYLAGDNFVLRIRAFGTADIQSSIVYTIESETLSFNKIEKTGTNIIEIPLGSVSAGKHKIKISAKAGNQSDAIVRDFDVLTSYFSKNKTEFYELSSNLTNIQGGVKGYTTLLFTSYQKARFYNMLHNLSYQAGVRLDQKFTSILAKLYLNKFFNESNEIEDADALNYQYQGGVALLPYSDSELELSAIFANLIQGEPIIADQEALKQYLYSSLSDRKTDLNRISAALYGLSISKEPILITVQNIKKDQQLTLKDRIYLALALDNLGAKEEARIYYKTEIKPNLTFKQPYIFINRFQNQDENIITTILVAGLAASLSEPEADGLGQYALENYPKETLKNFEMLLYFKNILPLLKDQEASFSYQALQKNGSKIFKGNEVFKLELSKEELVDLKFSDINGRIGLTSLFEEEATPQEIKKDKTIGISRTYSVNGQQTTEFKEGDLVRINLVPFFGTGSFEGSYQIIDYLPSGLRAATNIQAAPFRQNEKYPRYPSSIEDQKITFIVSKNYSRPFFYYARVVSKGEYKAEPALIQSLKSREIVNISDEAKVIIK